MKVDTHEPSEAFQMLSQTTLGTEMAPLNDQGYADFLWPCFGGGLKQAERKQWGELLSDLDAIEDQLRRQMQAHPDVPLMLIAEGLALTGQMGTMVYKRARHKANILVCKGTYPKSLNLVYAWLYQVSKYIEVYFTADLVATCTALTAFYKADQKEEHHTFHRYLKDVTFHPNPQVQRLLGLTSKTSGVGPALCQALIKEFGTVWRVLNAKPGQLQVVEGVGPKLAVKILRDVGRADV